MPGNGPHELGHRAEDFAAGYVASLGWRVLGRNILNRHGEIDIAAMDGDELVVVEVRFRAVGKVQSAVDSVGPKKLRALIDAGRALVEERGWTGFWRIDLIGITGGRNPSDETGWRLEHLRDITEGTSLPL